MVSNADITAANSPAKQIDYEFEFEFTSSTGIFVRTDATVKEAFECLRTGLLRNAPVSRVKLFTVAGGNDIVAFTYDVNAAQKGNPPWSLLLTTV